MKTKIYFKEGAYVPNYKTPGSVGLDLAANYGPPSKNVNPGKVGKTLQPLERVMVPTGIFVEIPEGFEGQVRPRSGLAAKQGIGVLNAPGTIDQDYRGEIHVILVNLSSKPVTISHGDRIAQLVICPVSKDVEVRMFVEGEMSKTERGEGGFGHTGVR